MNVICEFRFVPLSSLNVIEVPALSRNRMNGSGSVPWPVSAPCKSKRYVWPAVSVTRNQSASPAVSMAPVVEPPTLTAPVVDVEAS